MLLLASIVMFTVWTVFALTPLMLKADRSIAQFLFRYLSPNLNREFTLVRAIGNLEVTTLLAVLTGISLIRSGRTQMAFTLWALFIGGNIVELLGKHLLPQLSVHYPLNRLALNLHPPDLTERILEDVFRPPYGYPSGHAFRILLLAAVGWLAWRPPAGRYPTLLRSAGIMSGLAIVVALAGVAVVYLGDHRASEVIGGYLLGIICIATLDTVLADSRTSGGTGCTGAK